MRRTIAKITSTVQLANPVYLIGVACVAAAGGLLCGVGLQMGTDVVRTIFAWYL